MLFAILATTLAGLSTGLGGLVVLFCKKPGARMMGFSLGFAAGVMVTVSLADMLPHTAQTYAQAMERFPAAMASASLCLLGMVAAVLLERCVPEPSFVKAEDAARQNALRSAMVTTAAIVLHNLPEGVLTLFTGYASPALGLTLALAIALHNIPEGIAIAVPVYYATGSKGKAMGCALVSGLAEPIGAMLAFWLLVRWISPFFLNGLIALVAGIMLMVSFRELLPESLGYGKRGHSVAGLCTGVLVMHLGLYLV